MKKQAVQLEWRRCGMRVVHFGTPYEAQRTPTRAVLLERFLERGELRFFDSLSIGPACKRCRRRDGAKAVIASNCDALF